MVEAGRSLYNYMRVMRDNPHIVPKGAIKDMLVSLDLHIRACRSAGISYTPKTHAVCHMTLRTASLFIPSCRAFFVCAVHMRGRSRTGVASATFRVDVIAETVYRARSHSCQMNVNAL